MTSSNSVRELGREAGRGNAIAKRVASDRRSSAAVTLCLPYESTVAQLESQCLCQLSSPGGGENIVMPTHSVAVLANGLLAVRMAKAVGGNTVHWLEVTLAESLAAMPKAAPEPKSIRGRPPTVAPITT